MAGPSVGAGYARADAHGATGDRAYSIVGTTLEAAAMVAEPGDGSYQHLFAGPGWPLIVRGDLARPGASRDARRTALASIVQTTDLHLLDSESPVRAEFVHPFNSSAFRSFETLTVHGALALVERINSIGVGPFSGRPFDCLVSTGDNTDNHEHVELDWFLSVFDGGTIAATTGDRDRYDGVQSWGSPLYWQPEATTMDEFKKRGFPHIPGFFHAVVVPVRSPGLDVPWYSVFGNHDNSIEGVLAAPFDDIRALYTGTSKLDIPGVDTEIDRIARVLNGNPALLPAALVSGRAHGPLRTVAGDERRAPFTAREYMAAHRRTSSGPGPVGHGFSAEAVETGTTYYRFDISPTVAGIAVDSTNHAGFVDGSIGQRQVRWIEAQLTAGSSRYYDEAGNLVHRPGAEDVLFVIFSHHTSTTMDVTIPDPNDPADPRATGSFLVDFFGRFPNIVAWVNGHTHDNRVTPHHGPTPDRSFWEINTASHIDYPQNARILDICDNRDGTLSIFATLIESSAPYTADVADLSPRGLAALYRELSYNDPGRKPDRIGSESDRNVELLLPSPYA